MANNPTTPKLFQGGVMQRPLPISTTQNVIEKPETCAKCEKAILDETWWFVESLILHPQGERFHYHIDCAIEVLFNDAKHRDNVRRVARKRLRD